MEIGKGGAVFIGVTALLALMDGALIAALAAAGIAFGSFAVLCHQIHKPGSVLAKQRETELRDMVLSCKNKELRKKMEEAVKQDLAELAKARELDKHGGQEAAKWIAVGAFACPPLALAIVAAQLALRKRAQAT